MAINPKILAVTTNTGDRSELPPAGVTCIVGGNNVGKSQLLRDIVMLLETLEGVPKVLTSVELTREPAPDLGTTEAWLRDNSTIVEQQTGIVHYQPMSGGPALTSQQFHGQIAQGGFFLGPARSFYCWHADGGSRVTLGDGIGINVGMQNNPHPLAKVFRIGALEAKLSTVAKQAFGIGLTLDRVTGGTQLRLGEVVTEIPPFNNPTKEYTDAVEAMPPLQHQGDGVRSFVGLALYVAAGPQSMLLIDEPEAFLHPSQAKALGRWLASESISSNRQVIVATHSRDMVVGILEAECEATVLRLTRAGNESHIHQLESEMLKEVWDSPVLRYSNVLDGLFYETVAICESDGDCRFYAAVLDGLKEAQEVDAVSGEVLFVPSGGKQGIPKFANTMSALDVKTFAIADCDVLRTKAVAKQILESLGGDWTGIEADYQIVANAMNANDGILWNSLKTVGLAIIPAGAPSAAAARIVENLRIQRFLVVPIGELESFDRTITADKPAWVAAMLEKSGHLNCEAARDFVRGMFNGQGVP